MSAQQDTGLPLPLPPRPLAYTALVLQGIWALSLLPPGETQTVREAGLDNLARRVAAEARTLSPALTRLDA